MVRITWADRLAFLKRDLLEQLLTLRTAADVPSAAALTGLGQEALLLAVAVSLPVVAIAALIGLIVAVLQAATQVQDATLGHLPRLLVVALVLALMAPWMGSEIAAFALRAFRGG